MSRRIYLHIGSHKTGTTAVQNWLQTNAPELRKIGLLVPRSGRAPNGNSRALAIALAHDPDDSSAAEICQPILAKFKTELKRNPDMDVLISAEYFSLILTQPSMRLAVRRLRQMQFEISTALFVRNPIDLINSAFAHRCKTLRDSEDFDIYLKEFFHLKRGHWPLRLRRMEKLELNPTVLVHAPKYFDDSVARRLMEAFGLSAHLPKDLDMSVPKMNGSLRETGVLTAFSLRQILRGAHTGRIAKTWLSEILVDTVHPFETRKFNGLSTAKRSNILSTMVPQLDQFAEEYLNGDSTALLASETEGLAQSPLNVDEIKGEVADRIEHLLHTIVSTARSKPEFSTHFPADPFRF